MSRVYNFSAGPSQMSAKVLQKAADEMLDYKGTGESVMEMSHRSKEYGEIIDATRQKLKDMMNVPDNYKILFLQGGGSTQFTMVAMNLMNKYKKAAYVCTGSWAKKAAKEAKKFGEVEVLASSEEATFSYIPKDYETPTDIDYFYICENNTIYGTKYHTLPDTKGAPLVADLSSCILSEPVDVSKYGIIFAGAQKNLGMAGLTIVIIREDLIVENDALPSMLSYYIHAKNNSMFNTPPCYAIYMLGNVLDWMKEDFGDLENLKKINQQKADLLYGFLDNSKMFSNPVAKEDRSMMNVTFVTGNDELDKKCVAEAKALGMINLKGHRSVGGLRASIYNAMPLEGVQKLVDFLAKFEKENS